MTSKVKPIPDGYHTMTPYLIVQGGTDAIAFYKKAFGATEIMSMADKAGKVMHAEMKLGNSHFMLADEHPEMNARGPKSFGGSPISIHLYVENVDSFVDHAVKSGAKLIRPVQDQFYGDRMGGVEDPFGHHWFVATHIKDVSDAEISSHCDSAKKQ